MNTSLDQLFNTSLQFDPWIVPIFVFAFSFAAALILKRIVWSNFKNWNMPPLLSEMIQSTEKPTTWFVLVLCFNFAASFTPETIPQQKNIQLFLKLVNIVVAVWLIDRLISAWLKNEANQNHTSTDARAILRTLVRVISFAIGMLMILDSLGVSIAPILASLGVGSLAVALALQEPLSNFFNGLYLVTDKPIRVGDFVKIDESVEGQVIQIGWRTTKIRTAPNNIVIIPNSKISSSQITNFDLEQSEVAVVIPLSVGYSCNLENVEVVTKEVARKILQSVEGGVAQFEPIIRFHTFADSSINFNVILRAQSFTDQHLLRHEFIKAIHHQYQAVGIEIPFPQRVIHSLSK